MLQDLNWRSDTIDVYIREMMEAVKEVDSILATIKDNVNETVKILKSWEKNLMFERKVHCGLFSHCGDAAWPRGCA